MKKISYLIIIFLYSIIIYRIIDIKYLNNFIYQNLYETKSNNIIYGNSAKRGRILDRNNIVLVDNQTIYNINYRIIKKTSYNDIYEYSKKISDSLSLSEQATLDEMKRFYLLFYDSSFLINKNEYNDYKYRKITEEELYNLKYERLNEEELNLLKEKSNYIHTFFNMINGYNYETKLIKEEVTYEECLDIEKLNINGLSCNISYKRIINYPFINSILGNVGKISIENKDKYLNMGYSLNDIVGICGLEEYYENILKGKKAKYQVNEDNTLTLLEDEIQGKDLVLAIDIKLQEYVYNTLKEYFEVSKKMNNTKYFNESYVIISNPNNGEILSLQGLLKNEINNDISYMDISSKAMISSYTVGSVVKGASHTVGYLNNLIDIGKKIQDSCVKLYNIPIKCSFKRLGYIDDITALKMSSNYYQFITAIKSTNNTYHNNMKIDVNENNFNLYRDVFKKYGLGDFTYIDFPKESKGIMGNKISMDLLLNLSIGQYDTYTPIQLSAYINTIATKGKRYKLSFIKNQEELISQIDLDDKYMNRIHEGFYKVVNEYNGTGNGYTDIKFNAAGKTGTAQNYYDKDVMTINSTYVMFAPIDNPKYSVVVLTPNISYYNNKEYIAPINRLISKKITNYLFENY